MYDSFVDVANGKQEKELRKVIGLLEDEGLFSGLSSDPVSLPSATDFHVITNVVHAAKLMSEQPESGYFKALGRFCYTPEVLGEAGNQLENSVVSEKKYLEINTKMTAARKADRNRQDELNDIISSRFDALGITDSWYGRKEFKGMKKTDREFLAVEMVQNHIYACFELLVVAAFFGGVKSNRYSQAIYNGFAAGGIPSGWLGAKNFEALDKLDAPVVLLHLGASQS